MRYRTLEIRWHDSKPISSCDFQPLPFKKARPASFATQSYRLATAGEDNHVRLWMVHPHLCSDPPRPARVEYLATLSRHSAAVNVVRWAPAGDLLASAGDDGMVIIWAPSSTPPVSTYGSDLTAEELANEKEFWRPRTTFKCTSMQVYDLAWSPTGEFLLTGSTDNTARIYSATDGKCLHEIAEHAHYIQGVAWDPLGEYISTQSSDRSMHIYRVNYAKGAFEVHAVGLNTRFSASTRTPSTGRHSRTSSVAGHERPRMFRSQSITSDVESDAEHLALPPTPASGAPPTPMFPPPGGASSRRSSFSGSNAPSSPSGFSRYGRSPSPMPALPAIRTPPSAGAGWAGRYRETEERGRSLTAAEDSWRRHAHTGDTRMYGDEGFTNFFRRLGFSPDGALLLTPAGTFEDPSVAVPPLEAAAQSGGEDSAAAERGRKARPMISTDLATTQATTGPASSVYIYSRANFARPPVAQLPGHKKASVAVRFGPVLFELRAGVAGADGEGPKIGVGTATGEEGERERDVEERMDVDLLGSQMPPIAAPVPQLGTSASFNVLASPALSPVVTESRRPGPPTPAASRASTPHPTPSHANSVSQPQTGSIFALPYRMLYAVVTMDTVAIYDTQQAGPVCLLTKLHYDEFTDLTWSPDGQCLMLSSRDGYCTLVTFDEILPAHHTQQAALQLQQIAAAHSVPMSYSVSGSGSQGVAGSSAMASGSGTSKKRPLEPLTPATSIDGDGQSMGMGLMTPSASGASIVSSALSEAESVGGERGQDQPVDGPPKKKRRVALTRVGDL
ncbi:WD40 repeat-like protein [Roridomyces roridus]|uniref:WD40 repeat-like protein n=1 Tax=Roridomyces roridus TaxID=1738132 RepID=A0AAD7BRY3_9AGAR|nr:WD40 repeat-like protein [Roridomyces roridus]